MDIQFEKESYLKLKRYQNRMDKIRQKLFLFWGVRENPCEKSKAHEHLMDAYVKEMSRVRRDELGYF